MAYKLLEGFRKLFDGKKYNHRISTQGDHVAALMFEDLFDLGKSPKFSAAVGSQDRVSNRRNKRTGIKARRGDGTFGERVPNTDSAAPPGMAVSIGQVATIEIGSEVKVLAKAMIKQLDRVGTDMKNQVAEFRSHGGNPICVGIVGINYAATYMSYERRRKWPTDGKEYKHPIQEAPDAELRLTARVKPLFFEFLVLRFTATNVRPHPFTWVDQKATEDEYGAALVRISREYERRF